MRLQQLERIFRYRKTRYYRKSRRVTIRNRTRDPGEAKRSERQLSFQILANGDEVIHTMSFKREKAKMLRILRACDAPREVVVEFEAICRYRWPSDAATAEDILLDACTRHNFIDPWQDENDRVVFRPYNVSRECSAFLPDHSTTPDGEQSYRRGFHQGAARILNDLARGRPLAELKLFARELDQWRRQAVQYRAGIPGSVRPEGLPTKWDNI